MNVQEHDSSEDFFGEDEKIELLETITSLLENIILDNALIYSDPDYKELISEQVFELLKIQFEHLFTKENSNNEEIEEDLRFNIERIINKGFKLIHKHICPKRSCKRTSIKHKPNIEKLQKKINILQNTPQPEQKSHEWYQFRHSKLTASNIWKVFSSDANRNQLIYDKCQEFDPNKYKNMSFDGPLHWGNKYEPLSVMFYEHHYGTKVSDFGCILHNKYPFLAASPDGINTCIESKRYGRMLEIKNIVNREINGIPKIEYWIQMQMQMEVCNLNECDFLETKFVEYENFDDFMNDGTFSRSSTNELKGIILCFINNDKPLYEYAPIEITEEEFEEWRLSMFEKHKELEWLRDIYWKLDEFSCVLVLRNKLWFKHAVPILEEFWSIIEKEKGADISHRAPKKKERKNNKQLETNKCFIDIKKLNISIDTSTDFYENNILIDIEDNKNDIDDIDIKLIG